MVDTGDVFKSAIVPFKNKKVPDKILLLKPKSSFTGAPQFS